MSSDPYGDQCVKFNKEQTGIAAVYYSFLSK